MKFQALFTCIIFLSGCDGVIDKFLNENPDAFNEPYKESFVEACVEPENTDEKKQLCSCIADELINNHSPSELINEKNVEKYIDDVAIQKCMGDLETET